MINNILQSKSVINTTHQISGWVRTVRVSKAGFAFININDGSCFANLQLVAPKTLENYHEVLKLTTGCSIRVVGKIVSSQLEQQIEMQVEHLQVLGWVDDPATYPMASKKHSLEHLRDYAHLRPRTNLIGAVARVRSAISFAIHKFFAQNNFYWIATPIITTSDTEGAGEMFRVSTLDMNLLRGEEKIDFSKDFFGKEAFLTVSGQLNAEAYACALGKVYTFGPTFRAENSNTSRHLAEFWMVEPEVAFADLDQNANLASEMLKFVFKDLLNSRLDDLEFFTKYSDSEVLDRIEKLSTAEFNSIDYTDAITILEKAIAKGHKFDFPVSWGIDLAAEHERFLAEQYFNAPVIIKNYPKAIKAFYMRLNEDNKTVAAMDVLVPGLGEIIGGSQREERLDVLDRRIQEMGLNIDDYWWYRDLRRYGTVPHAGFGLGLERLVAYITGVHNVRDVIAFPRTPKSANF